MPANRMKTWIEELSGIVEMFSEGGSETEAINPLTMSIIPRVIKMHLFKSTGDNGRINNRSVTNNMTRLIRIVMENTVMRVIPGREDSKIKRKAPMAISCPWARFITFPVLNIRTNPIAERAYTVPREMPLNKRFHRSIIFLSFSCRGRYYPDPGLNGPDVIVNTPQTAYQGCL